jgi:cytosine/adenosine deaminase-related metal-dependent hydrolase
LAISIPEVASDEMLSAVYARCAESGAIFQTHVNEHLAAVERSLVQRGMRPLELLHHVGALGPQALVAHATLITASELDILRATDTAVSYNPVASQWKGNAVANATLMAMLGIRFGIGTDGTRSDGFRMIDAAEATQKLAFGLGHRRCIVRRRLDVARPRDLRRRRCSGPRRRHRRDRRGQGRRLSHRRHRRAGNATVVRSRVGTGAARQS